MQGFISKFSFKTLKNSHRLLGTQLNPGAINHRESSDKTMLIQCSTTDAKVQVPKMIQWQDIKLPTEWLLEQESPLVKPVFDELDLTRIQQYLDGTEIGRAHV